MNESKWLAKYEIEAEDDKGPWELLSPIMPTQDNRILLTETFGKWSYKGLYLVGCPQRTYGYIKKL